MKTSSSSSEFYTYVYTDPEREIPIYVGKGCGQRSEFHIKKTATNTTPVSKSVGNAISGASAGAVIGGIGGVPGAIAGALVGAIANVAIGRSSPNQPSKG